MKKKVHSLAALLLVGILVFSFAACNSGNKEEETTTTEAYINSKTEKPTGTADLLVYYNRLMDEVKQGKPKLSISRNQGVNDVKTENKDLEALANTLKGYMLNDKGKGSEKFGDDLKDLFPVKGQEWSSKLDSAAVRYATISELEKSYVIMIYFKDEANPALENGNITKAFNLPDFNKISEELKKAEKSLTVGEIGLTYTGCTIKCTVDRIEDRISSVEFVQNVMVDTTVKGVGTLAAWGENALTFKYSQTDNYNLDWVDPATTTTAAAK